MKILLVEDDEAVGGLILTALKLWKQEVLLARNGEEAWRTLQENPSIDLLIVDWQLPELNGTELVRRARGIERFKNLSVLMISGRAGKPDILNAINSGIDGYLTKPFTPTQLRDKIKAISGGHKRLSVDEQVREILRGCRAFAPSAQTPLILFGDAVNTADRLKESGYEPIVRFFMRAVQAVTRANKNHPGLHLGYLIETHTKDLIQLLARPEIQKRVKLLLLSTECRGNSILLMRLLNINKREGMQPVLVCDQPRAIPQVHRRGLDKMKIPVWKRSQLDGERWDELIAEYVQPKAPAPPTGVLAPEEIRQRITDDLEDMASLPVLPQVYQQIIQLDADPQSDIKEWGKAIRLDPMSSALIIRRARSSAYGFQGTIDQVERAVVLLGKKEIKELVACDSMQRTFSAVEEHGFSLEAFWLHSVAVGFAAHLLAFPLEKDQWTPAQTLEFTSFGFVSNEIAFLREVNLARALGIDTDVLDPFTAGLMHDIGKAAMVQAYPGLYALLAAYLEERSWRLPMLTAERQTAGGLTHTAVGEILGRHWGWDDELCEAIRSHHSPDLEQPLGFLISLADLVGHMLYPFPVEYSKHIKEAVETSDMDELDTFLPDGFFDQPYLTQEDCVKLVRIVAPAARRLTVGMRATVGVGY